MALTPRDRRHETFLDAVEIGGMQMSQTASGANYVCFIGESLIGPRRHPLKIETTGLGGKNARKYDDTQQHSPPPESQLASVIILLRNDCN